MNKKYLYLILITLFVTTRACCISIYVGVGPVRARVVFCVTAAVAAVTTPLLFLCCLTSTKMKSDSKSLLTAQAEKANHYTSVDSHSRYLKEFRVEQCPLFIQRKCTQHRPFTCFNWHFMNQRRRRPVRKRDRTFNYSADNYCSKYDETTGICPDGDECPFLHRTAGDTERRYHLRYYKTCMCVHDTDTRGFCVKNGPHCAFAHGNHDLRPPVYDIKEIQALENPDSDPNSSSNGPNILDKERNLMNEDPKWQDTNYVLSNYKTEPCKRPPRLCRQGYACPQYHNSKDKRRSPRKSKYRSTPCPNVKHGEEWGEPGNCDQGDNCMYCHTRTEQQFHPEIYKSTKCNDVQQAGYCPRGVFCAFAHVDREFTLINLLPTEDMGLARDMAVPIDCGTNLADLLSNALPPDKRSHDKDKQLSDSSNGSGEVSESASTSSLGSNNSHSKAPGAQLHNSSTNSTNNQHKLSSMLYNPNFLQFNELRKQVLAIENDPTLTKSEKSQRRQSIVLAYNINGSLGHSLASTISPLSSSSFYPNDTVESVVGNALDELHLDDPLNLVDSIHRETSSPISNSISAGLASSGLLGSSAPVNIPGMTERSVLSNFSPSTSSPLQNLQSAGFLTGSRFSHQDPIESTMPFLSHSVSDPFTNHITQLSSSTSKLSGFNSSLFDFANQGLSPSRTQPLGASPLVNAFSISPSNSGSMSEVQRLREELTSSRAQLATWDERINQARAACSAWQMESEEAKRKASVAEQQRDEALMQVKVLKNENEAVSSSGSSHLLSMKRNNTELRNLSIGTLKSLQTQLRQELEEVEKVLYRETATKCMVCEEQNRAVTLSPCNHYVRPSLYNV
ncbi:Similar to UNK: RING finger protein unkempt homolog (Canis lupus familiaris) [Cotesia congregata]|uniref:Similar to UNK: RING finger protein unkempt homolog (Canis lupus familiaris) n=1 Tax=Cotesia congregata TaxID=51543 RepID=A0A8J2MM60_COTCN|nr:Similar to UNK: RING finger protein unkempt homolog (Canis lupus familiaris) [Cotesia congregata]